MTAIPEQGETLLDAVARTRDAVADARYPTMADDARPTGTTLGVSVLFGITLCAGLGAVVSAAGGQGFAMGATDRASCGLVLGALAGSVLTRARRRPPCESAP